MLNRHHSPSFFQQNGTRVLIFVASGAAIISFIIIGAFYRTSSEKLVDSNLNSSAASYKILFAKVCSHPCWLGITPKKSTPAEAIQLLTHYFGEENVQMRDYSIDWQAGSTDSFSGQLSFSSGTPITGVRIVLKEDFLTVEDFVKSVGQPVKIGVVIAFSSNTKCAGVLAFYPSQGITIALYPDDKFVGVNKSQSIYSIEFSAPWSQDIQTMTDTFYVDWDGYRDYCPEKFPWES